MSDPELIQINILLEDRLLPIPEGIGVERFYENLDVIFETETGLKTITGDHAIAIGTEDNIKKWLKPHSPICVGFGPLMLQNFKLQDVV